MAHEAAKLLLQQAESNEQRTEAVRAALALGMPLSEIEAYLDWLDSARGRPPETSDDDLPPPGSGESSTPLPK